MHRRKRRKERRKGARPRFYESQSRGLSPVSLLAAALVACGKSDEKLKVEEKAKVEEKLKVQADIAKVRLQQKADDLARSAATNTQP